MNRSTPFLALAFWVAALGFPAGAHAGDAQSLPDLGSNSTNSVAQDALARDAVCTKCHDEEDGRIMSIYQTRHGVKADARTPSCQSCHGSSDEHIQNTKHNTDVVFGSKKKVKTASTSDTQNEVCLGCHKAGERVNWSGSEHQNHDLACSSCHKVHVADDPILSKVTQPEVCEGCHKTERAQFKRISVHPVHAGEMACSDCHNAHGSTGPKLLVKNTVNETCYTCHAEKRGPFLWEHSPVTDDCSSCHTPHGSTNSPLLKQRAPWLCQDCHTADHAAGINSASNFENGDVTSANGALPQASRNPRAQTNGRNCLSCHVLVHGSNHPAGAKFQR